MNGTSGLEESQQQRLDPVPPLSSGQTCCLIDSGIRCKRLAGNASYSKRVQRTVHQKKLKLSVDPEAKHVFICDGHKNTIQHLRNKQKNREGRSGEHCESMERPGQIEINFAMLPVGFLRRYKRHLKLTTRPGSNKVQLAEIVSRHFAKTQVNEMDVVTQFLHNIRNRNNRQENNDSVI